MKQKIKGIVFDIDGVIYTADRVLPGAVETVAALKREYPVRFVTNTTRKTRQMVLQKLRTMGFAIEEDEVFTALDATYDFLKREQSSAYALTAESVAGFFDPLAELPLRYVVVADAYTNFTYEKLNTAFRHLLGGARLLAVAENRYFRDKDGGLSLDAGGFVRALEYAAGTEAAVLGKPSRDFFHLACASMQLGPGSCLMIGDDIESDVAGAQRAGLVGVQVRTGKFTPADLERGIKPDAVVDDVTALPALLGRKG